MWDRGVCRIRRGRENDPTHIANCDMSDRRVAGGSPAQDFLEDAKEKPAVSGGFLEPVPGGCEAVESLALQLC